MINGHKILTSYSDAAYVTRYAKVVNELAARVRQQPGRHTRNDSIIW